LDPKEGENNGGVNVPGAFLVLSNLVVYLAKQQPVLHLIVVVQGRN